MDAVSLEAQPMLGESGTAVIDVDQVTQELCRELGGKVGRETIRRVVLNAVATYQDARFPTYVPILVRRDALRELRDRR